MRTKASLRVPRYFHEEENAIQLAPLRQNIVVLHTNVPSSLIAHYNTARAYEST